MYVNSFISRILDQSNLDMAKKHEQNDFIVYGSKMWRNYYVFEKPQYHFPQVIFLNFKSLSLYSCMYILKKSVSAMQ